MIALRLACVLLLGLATNARVISSDVERWELPEGATYKNVKPLIGIMTQVS